MQVNNINYRTIWYDADNESVRIIDQRYLPFKFIIEDINSLEDMLVAIFDMHLRGAGLIGAAAAWGMYLAVKESQSYEFIESSANKLLQTRPTAVNLQAAIDKMLPKLKEEKEHNRLDLAFKLAQEISDYDADSCKRIGEHGYEIIKEIQNKKAGERVNILTHCNAGWLAFVDYGSALSPIYEAFNSGIDIHVYVDETRPRNQGARLTAWELGMQNIPHTLIADNVGGHLMQNGKVDMVIVGADRVAANGDVANKIGTYLKALAAYDNNVPFYVAFPSTTLDKTIENGIRDIPIEERSGEEVLFMDGLYKEKEVRVRIAPEFTTAVNYGFDVTPARLVSGYITEEGTEFNNL
ncbi:MAG: S-methyl-5-thioribose-1-phosphate isomerase [Bacteroidetes bacterium]|nr:MAG: S-methyl-5-thioribose-1-phosphate isomerase [Bacteroidota bacterium]